MLYIDKCFVLARSIPEGKSEYDKSKKRLQAIKKKQETLLRGIKFVVLCK